MPLSEVQVRLLKDTIADYDYPCVTYDFKKDEKRYHPDMRSVENTIREQLTSGDVDTVKDGLSNVLYWGHESNKMLQKHKVSQFRKKVLPDNIRLISKYIFSQADSVRPYTTFVPDTTENSSSTPKLIAFEVLERLLPQFGFAFTTKLFMFLHPKRFVVLDYQIGKLHAQHSVKVFKGISIGKNGILTTTSKNIRVYEDWCNLC